MALFVIIVSLSINPVCLTSSRQCVVYQTIYCQPRSHYPRDSPGNRYHEWCQWSRETLNSRDKCFPTGASIEQKLRPDYTNREGFVRTKKTRELIQRGCKGGRGGEDNKIICIVLEGWVVNEVSGTPPQRRRRVRQCEVSTERGKKTKKI